MLYPTLAEQFARRQRDWKPNMNVVEDAPLYRVDGYLQGYYQPHPPNELNEVEMKCFETRRWQLVVHDDGSDCDPPDPPPRPPLLGKPRPPIVDPIECGQLYCTPHLNLPKRVDVVGRRVIIHYINFTKGRTN
jgi:hypothetical protein